ncbi:autophagy- protein 2 [Teratosphaeriaceae sp. CCFEE 6253]|nr:autophagy- protein 2 [Teratosphaeriaceae sp. CCFEE 6253]
MSWWQRKLLQYGLRRSGLFEDGALNLDDLNIIWGRRSVVELKDVALSGEQIGKLAQLPSGLRVETARVLSLRMTIPADLYQSGVEVDVDGIEVVVKLVHSAEGRRKQEAIPAASPTASRSPEHRKVHRRLRSPPPRSSNSPDAHGDDSYLPSAEEVAQSFLLEEPGIERRVFEASIATQTNNMEQSSISESSDGGDVGIGSPVSVPGFLAGFLKAMADRVQIRVANLVINLETELAGEGHDLAPVTLRLSVGTINVDSVANGSDLDLHRGQRNVDVKELFVELVTDSTTFSQLSEAPFTSSPKSSKRESETSSQSVRADTDSATIASERGPRSPKVQVANPRSTDSTATIPSQAGYESVIHDDAQQATDYDIKPGDDNISWGSRRRKAPSGVEDLWRSMASDDDLPESLLLDRAPTPRPHSSRSGSPSTVRSRRAVSPYDRAFQSPGSWPRLDESPQRQRSQHSLGSQLNLAQSQNSVYQSLVPDPYTELRDIRDNKQTALAASVVSETSSEADLHPTTSQMDREDSPLEDMAESRMYSHEEAQSLYTSAMTQGPVPKVPGGWGSEGPVSDRSLQSEGALDEPLVRLTPKVATHDDSESGNATPRAQSPARSEHATEDHQLESKQLLSIDHVSVWLPSLSESDTPCMSEPAPPHTDVPNTRVNRDMPGAFSMHSEAAASRLRERPPAPGNSRSMTGRPQTTGCDQDKSLALDVRVGSAVASFDLASARILYKMMSAATNRSAGAQTRQSKANNEDSIAPHQAITLSLSIRQIRLSMLERLAARHALTQDVGLVALECVDATFNFVPGDTDLQVGRVQAWMSGSELVAFDRASTLRDSSILTEPTPDVKVRFAKNKVTVQKRPVSELVFELLPLKLQLDLGALDDTLGSFGGLSGVLELSNSLLSDSGPLAQSTTAQRPAKGVRFAGEPNSVKPGPELKVNGRIAGTHVTLRGETCAVDLRSSTLKAVYREHGSSVTVGHIALSGPHLPSRAGTPLSADIAALRLDYLVSPEDTDLERLLLLLTPSKDKYDNDDDILLETLLRQRRKGGLMRVRLDGFKLDVADWICTEQFTALGAELSKLSVMAKYLPEDDRPGLLSLVRVRSIEMRLPVNKTFGTIKLDAQEFHCAHVGFPSLIALSLDSVKATGPRNEELVHPLTPASASDVIPMLMTRMLGDEAEPSIKIKVVNTCVEYSVPTVLALTGTGPADVEGLVADLVRSVADLTVQRADSEKSTPPHGASPSTKRTNVDILVHDSALGLTPDKSSSKGLLVLTDVKLRIRLPPSPTMRATLQLRKAAIFVIDDRDSDCTQRAASARAAANNTTTSAQLSAALTKRGFVSVGSIMTATVLAEVTEASDRASKSVTIDVSNDLLLLETCADSTQTLFAVLGGLAPPAPPSERPKYLTEPMSIEAMMASFTGEPIAERVVSPETLFDVNDEAYDDADMLLDDSAFGGNADGLLLESEMTSSLYGPVSGMLTGLDRPDDDDDAQTEDFSETVKSLLDDDPFEMPLFPTDIDLSDSALLRQLKKQCKPAVSEQQVDLGLYEIEDLGMDALNAASGQPLGSAHRFSTPTSKARKLPAKNATHDLPFRLRLRDTHVIWNVYDGYDWQYTRDGITHVVEQVEARAEERKACRRRSHTAEDEDEPVIGDFLFNSIYVGVPATRDVEDLRRHINRGIDDLVSETESVPVSGMSRPTAYSASGRPLRQHPRRRLKLERSKAHKVAFELKGVSADLLVYPDAVKDAVSDLDLRVGDVEIFDNVSTSTWRKFLTCLDDGTQVREMSKPMAHIEVNTVRTLENFAASELIIHASILPLRLHVDQDALDFIVRFFEFKDNRTPSAAEPAEQPFIQRLEVDTVDLRLDYKPKRIDYGGLRSGHTNELMNIISLDAANIRLMHAIIYGIRGFEPLHKTLNDIWMPDVKRNQLPTVLAGLGPVRGLVNIGSGVRDVVAIPIREYKKDGRIVRSIQKGAMHFGKTTTSELARLGAKLAIGTQTILQGAEGLLSPSAASSSGRPAIGRRASSEHGWHDVNSEGEEEHEQRAISAYANQPIGVLSGLRSARLHLEHDLLTARDALIAVQGEILESGSPGGIAAAVARHAPTVILRPVIGASKAVGTTLLGVGNQIDRQNMRRMDDKYKKR